MSISLWTFSEFLGVLFVITAAVYIYFKCYVFNFWRKLGIAYIEPIVPFGNIMPVLRDQLAVCEYTEKLYAKYKHHRLVGVYTFYKPNLVVVDLDLIRDILIKEFSSFHDRGTYCDKKLDPLSGNLFSLSGRNWRNVRVRLVPTLTSGKIKQMFIVMKETGDILKQLLEKEAKARTIVDIKNYLARYSMDVVISTSFGINCNSLEHPDNEFVYWGNKVFPQTPFWNAIFLFAPKLLSFFSIPFTDRGVTRFFMKIFKNTVEYRESKNVIRKDFLNLLIQLMRNGYVEADEPNGDTSDLSELIQNKFTMTEAAAQAFSFYAAGFESSSSLGTFCLYELALNQEIQEKVREEIRSVIQKHGDITYNAVMEMTYLHQVIAETLRKYPPLCLLNRVCTKPIKLSGSNVTIPEDTLVTIPVYALHRDPAIYPDPEKFDPERFTKENIAARHPFAYLPFGEGPRMCIASRLGLVLSKIAIVCALLNCKFKPAPNTPRTPTYEKGHFIVKVKGGMHLTIEPVEKII